MPDSYKQLRNIPFPVLASELGIDLSRFRQRGDGEYIGPCPVHRPKNNTTSFSYSPDGKFHCFSCEIKGRGSIDLSKAVLDIGFKDAVERLKNLPDTPAPAIENQPAEKKAGELKPYKGSYEKVAVSCPWLEERITDAEIRQRYGVFCYNNPARKSAFSGRVMLPIKSLQGILYGYLGRSVSSETEPKYLFPKDLPKSEFLFGAHELSTFGPLPLKLVYLDESPFAVMKLAMMGLPAVSPFG